MKLGSVLSTIGLAFLAIQGGVGAQGTNALQTQDNEPRSCSEARADTVAREALLPQQQSVCKVSPSTFQSRANCFSLTTEIQKAEKPIEINTGLCFQALGNAKNANTKEVAQQHITQEQYNAVENAASEFMEKQKINPLDVNGTIFYDATQEEPKV